MSRVVAYRKIAFGVDTDAPINTWVAAIVGNNGRVLSDPAVIATKKRVLVQNRGVTQSPAAGGNVYAMATQVGAGSASMQLPASTNGADGILIAAPTPAAGPLYPSTWIDETPCPHDGEWWLLADTSGLIVVVMVWN